jgi:AcrR family transcriptional regulator
MPARSPEYMQARHAEIIDAAMACMVRLGAAKVSLSDICEQAGVSRGAFYVHFASKDEVLCGVIDRLRDSTIEESNFASPEELRDVLYAQVRRHDLPDRGKLAMVELELLLAARESETLRKALAAAFKQRYSQFEAGLASLGAMDHLQPGVSPQQAAELILPFLTGEVIGSMAAARPVASKLAAIDLMLAAILKPASPPATPEPRAPEVQTARRSPRVRR